MQKKKGVCSQERIEISFYNLRNIHSFYFKQNSGKTQQKYNLKHTGGANL